MVLINTNEASIKYTAVIPAKYVAELKRLAAQKVIASVNAGIREAIEQYIAECERELYAQQMAEAMDDNKFVQRTLEMQTAFSHSDSEVGGQW